MPTLKLGTRGSQLALFQANAVATLLRSQPDVSCELVVIKTSGDRLAEAPLSQIGGKRLFVKEIEDALLEGSVDLAVHSSKDMPAVLPDGLAIGATLPREDPRDAIVMPVPSEAEGPGAIAAIEDIVRHLPRAPRIGTSSVRRTAQLLQLLPGASFGPIRGNLDTRLRKLDSGEYDAIVLAAAGLRRLGQGARISAVLPHQVCVPAPGQGIIAVEVRSHDHHVRGIVERINDPVSAAALAAERMVVLRLGGGCQMPIGACATPTDAGLTLTTVVLSLDGIRVARADATGAMTEAEAIGARAAERLLEQGAGEILAEVERTRAVVEGLQP